MKLYTEEQVRQAFRSGEINEGCTALQVNIDDFIDSLKPIELPTDEEIENRISTHNPYPKPKQMYIDWANGFERGAQWVMERIKVG